MYDDNDVVGEKSNDSNINWMLKDLSTESNDGGWQ
jgi:hypothetical protein